MGTNYYLRDHGNDDDPQYHIGKRSSAGAYCFDCGVTLCKAGESGVHLGYEFHTRCPKCGAATEGEHAGPSVRSCCSFSWAMPRGQLEDNIAANGSLCPTCSREREAPCLVIENEYGELFTLEKFMELVEACPLQFEHRGERFS